MLYEKILSPFVSEDAPEDEGVAEDKDVGGDEDEDTDKDGGENEDEEVV